VQPRHPTIYAQPMTTRTISTNLTPFTGPDGHDRAVAAGKKSAEVRRKKKVARDLAADKTATGLNDAVADLISTFERGNLAEAAAAGCQYLIALVVTGAVEVSGKDIAPLAQTFLDIARLEEGQSTSNHVVAHLSSKETLTRLTELRGQPTNLEAITPDTQD
jgi:hypothetical protein